MRILLATDGSPQARGAEVLAEWLSYKLSAKLLALFVRDVRLIRVPELLDLGALTIPLPVYREELEKALTFKGRPSWSASGRAAKRRASRWRPFWKRACPTR
jgi:nucleotide-binding universal stress UspA family protein